MPKYRQLHTKIVDSFDLPPEYKPIRRLNGCPALRKGPGFVYVMYNQDDDFYKIGSSVMPKKRVVDISREKRSKVFVVLLILTDDMNYLERFLHKLFWHKHVYDEWFWLDINDLKIIENMVNETWPIIT